MYKYKKEVSVTYFQKVNRTSIEDLKEGELVWIKVKSPYNYGIREWDYYGKLIKKTANYVYILHYFSYTNVINSWRTEEIQKKNCNPQIYTKKWAKKSIIDIYTVKTEEKKEIREFETNSTEDK